MDKELLYNQSGIKDITAYKAIRNLGKRGIGDMNELGYEVSGGEVWQAISGEREIYVVVVASFDRYAATIMLQEQEPTSNAVPVRVRDIMYADAGRLGYIYYDKMVDYIRTLSTDEEAELRKAIGEALVLKVTTNQASAATAAVALEERDKAREAAQHYENEVAELMLRLEAARAEADVLRRNIAEAKEIIERRDGELEAAQKEVDYLRLELAKAKETVQKLAEKAEFTEVLPCVSVEDIVESRILREELAAARREADIYKGLYEKMLARALG